MSTFPALDSSVYITNKIRGLTVCGLCLVEVNPVQWKQHCATAAHNGAHYKQILNTHPANGGDWESELTKCLVCKTIVPNIDTWKFHMGQTDHIRNLSNFVDLNMQKFKAGGASSGGGPAGPTTATTSSPFLNFEGGVSGASAWSLGGGSTTDVPAAAPVISNSASSTTAQNFENARRKHTITTATSEGSYVAYFQEAVVSAQDWAVGNLSPQDIMQLEVDLNVTMDVRAHPLTGRVDVVFASDQVASLESASEQLGYLMPFTFNAIVQTRTLQPYRVAANSSVANAVAAAGMMPVVAPSAVEPAQVVAAGHQAPRPFTEVPEPLGMVSQGSQEVMGVPNAMGAPHPHVGGLPPAANKIGALTVAEYRSLWASPGREGEW